jgi:hypothetical protein
MNKYVVVVIVRSVGIAMGYRMDSQGLIPSKGMRFFPTLQWLWGLPSLLFNPHWGLFPWGKAAGV